MVTMVKDRKLIPVKRAHLIASLFVLAILFSGILLFENWYMTQPQKRVLGVETTE